MISDPGFGRWVSVELWPEAKLRLWLIAKEPHEGHYKSLAFTGVVMAAPSRDFARRSLDMPLDTSSPPRTVGDGARE